MYHYRQVINRMRMGQSDRTNPTRESLSLPHREQIETWLLKGIAATTIYQALVEQFGFTGSYSSVRRYVQSHHRSNPRSSKCCCRCPVFASPA